MAHGYRKMTGNVLKSQAFKLKGRLFTFTVMQILEVDLAAFAQHLNEVIAKAPRLFDHAPIVLDCSVVVNEALDLSAICQCLRGQGLVPVAILSCGAFIETIAQAQGLAILHSSFSHDKELHDKKSLEEEQSPLETIKSKLVTTPVRSGQQVVSKGGDLVITAAVSHGAELLADGNIHVYGALRGRALAGIAGDRSARIFCQALEAELVSIAGFYRLSDAIETVTGPCQIYLQDEHIQIEAL